MTKTKNYGKGLIRAFLLGCLVSGVLTYLLTPKTYQWPHLAPADIVTIELTRGDVFVGHFVEFVDMMEKLDD